MTLKSKLFIITSACFIGLSSAQNTPAIPDNILAEQQKIAQLQQQLDDLKSQRDKIVVDRWKAKKESNDQKENLASQLEERKSLLDQEGAKRQNIMADLKSVKEEMDQIRTQNETNKAQYLSLGEQSQKIVELKSVIQGGIFAETPAQIQKFNKIETTANTLKSSPEALFSFLIKSALEQTRDAQQITLERKEILSPEGKSSMGEQLKLGSLFALQNNDKNQIGFLLAAFEKGQRNYIWNWKLPQNVNLLATQSFYSLKQNNENPVLIPVDFLMSPNFDPTAPEKREASTWDKFVDAFLKGGLFSWAIFILGIIGVLFALERFIFWLLQRHFSQKQLEKFFKTVQEQKWVEAEKLAQKFKGQWREIAHLILASRESSREITEKQLEQYFIHNIPKIEKRAYTISVLSAVAPLLGLLGTVFGMIEMFEAITLYGNNNPKMLAHGISIALVTTELGLAVAIPLQLLYNFISNRLDGLISQIQYNALRLVNLLWITH